MPWRARGSREPLAPARIEWAGRRAGGRSSGRQDMFKAIGIAAAFSLAAGVACAQAPNDAQIAHIAYTAGVVDVAAGKQALEKSKNKAVRDFAQEMVRDHTAVNDQALALVKKLGVTPQDNPTSQGLAKGGADKLKELGALKG